MWAASNPLTPSLAMPDLEERRLRLEEHRMRFEAWSTPFEALIRFAESIRSLLLLNGRVRARASLVCRQCRLSRRPRQICAVAGGLRNPCSVERSYSRTRLATQIAHAERDDGGVLAGQWRLAAIVCALLALVAFCVGWGSRPCA